MWRHSPRPVGIRALQGYGGHLAGLAGGLSETSVDASQVSIPLVELDAPHYITCVTVVVDSPFDSGVGVTIGKPGSESYLVGANGIYAQRVGSYVHTFTEEVTEETSLEAYINTTGGPGSARVFIEWNSKK